MIKLFAATPSASAKPLSGRHFVLVSRRFRRLANGLIAAASSHREQVAPAPADKRELKSADIYRGPFDDIIERGVRRAKRQLHLS